MPSNHLILCRPLLLPPSIFLSIRVFSSESVLHIRWPKYWSFSFSISLSNEYSGLISFRIDWLDLLAVQGTLKSHLQHHSSKTSIFLRSAFFIVQLSHPYMTTGKTIALTRRTLVGKGMSLPFSMLSRLVTAFLPRSKRLLISWLQSPSAVIIEKILGSSFTFSSIILIVEHLHIHFLMLPQHEIILQRRYYDYPYFTEGKTDSERFSHFLNITQLVGGGARTRTQVQTPKLYCHLNCLSWVHK